MNMPKVKVVRLEKDLLRAIKLIDKFLSRNNIDIKYSITLDYSMQSFGQFNPSKKNEISLNPSAFYDTKKELPHAKYYSTDFSLLAVAVHEFCHLLDEKTNLLKRYQETFPEKIIINKNSEVDRREELAEVLALYILNPYLVKSINKNIFDFFKTLFESPTPNTMSYFVRKWESWPDKIKKLCNDNWGIIVVSRRKRAKIK